MSDLFKSALSYIGSSSGASSTSTSSTSCSSSSEIIKLGGEPVKLHRVIAEGGSSYIYGGQFAKNNLIIAVKKIPCQHDNEDKILSEIKFMNEFNHINIAKYHGYNKIGGVYWIGMEYCSTLRLPLPAELVGSVFGQIICGVNYLHNLGVTHWDLKIENCMVGRDRMIKLIDFGSATIKRYNTSQLTSAQRNQLEDELFQLTTPMYRPPEILDLWSEMQIDFHVDIWALGCILYYIVHSEHPFSDSNKLAIINCKYARKPSPFQQIIEGLLVIQPRDRWSLEKVLTELRSLGVDYNSPVKLPFEDFQISLNIIPNNQSSTSLLHSIRGGAENLLKNLKESGSRIYSSPQQPPPQQPPLAAQPREPPPRRPPQPKPPVPPPPSEPERRQQLTGEDVIKPTSQPQAFDLIGGGFETTPGPSVAQRQPSPPVQSRNLMAAESLDLLGDFKNTPDLISSGGGLIAAGSTSQPGVDYLGDLLGLSQPSVPPVNNPSTPRVDAKKDPFDSLFSDQVPPPAPDKPLLPTSSSFNHLSSLKIDNKSEMVKSTPNLNDLFGDLLIDPAAGKGAQAPVGQSGIAGGASNQFCRSAAPAEKPKNFGIGPNFNNIQSGNKVPPSVPTFGSNAGRGAGFPLFTSNISSASTIDHSTFSQDKTPTGTGTSGFGSSSTDSKRSPQVGNKKVDLNAAFGELLNEQGFTGSSTAPTTARTINEMRRQELSQTKTPEELKVSDWVEGKRKNIRALLSSLHTVVWEGCSWKPASMAQMVEPNDVKKMYRKACLAIHPDKQRGEPVEELAKLIFVELNEAWAHFENEMK